MVETTTVPDLVIPNKLRQMIMQVIREELTIELSLSKSSEDEWNYVTGRVSVSIGGEHVASAEESVNMTR